MTFVQNEEKKPLNFHGFFCDYGYTFLQSLQLLKEPTDKSKYDHLIQMFVVRMQTDTGLNRSWILDTAFFQFCFNICIKLDVA